MTLAMDQATAEWSDGKNHRRKNLPWPGPAARVKGILERHIDSQAIDRRLCREQAVSPLIVVRVCPTDTTSPAPIMEYTP
jgi:hypothetical protein